MFLVFFRKSKELYSQKYFLHKFIKAESPTDAEGSMLGNLFVQSTSFEEKINAEDNNQAPLDEPSKDVFDKSKEKVRVENMTLFFYFFALNSQFI